MDTSIQAIRQAKTIESIRKVAENITVTEVEGSKMVKRESGRLTGTIAGQKVHNLIYQIRYWDDNTHNLYVTPSCGTTRNARSTGGSYVNYYSNLGRPVTCAKCQAR
jgi:hypothetical protein